MPVTDDLDMYGEFMKYSLAEENEGKDPCSLS